MTDTGTMNVTIRDIHKMTHINHTGGLVVHCTYVCAEDWVLSWLDARASNDARDPRGVIVPALPNESVRNAPNDSCRN